MFNYVVLSTRILSHPRSQKSQKVEGLFVKLRANMFPYWPTENNVYIVLLCHVRRKKPS